MEEKKWTIQIDVTKRINNICINLLKCIKGYAINKKESILNNETRKYISGAYVDLGKVEAFDDMSKYIDTYIEKLEKGE